MREDSSQREKVIELPYSDNLFIGTLHPMLLRDPQG